MTAHPLSCFKSQRTLLVLHFVSFALLYLPCRVTWYIGNLAVYLNSYWYAKLDATSFSTQRIISCFIISRYLTLMIAGRIVKKINPRLLTIIGVLFYNTGVLLGRITVAWSQMAFIWSFAILTGLGVGCTQAEIMNRIPSLVAKRTGLAFGILNNCFNVGALICQFVVTWTINPRNEEAGVRALGKFQVFRDKGVIDRVPDIFLVLGMIFSVCNLGGLMLTFLLGDRGLIYKKNSPDTKRSEATKSTTLSAGDANNGKQTFKSGYNALASDAHQHQSPDCNTGCDGHHQDVKNETKRTAEGTYLKHCDKDQTNESENDSHCHDLTYRQMLKTPRFYVMWFGAFADEASYVILLNYYKVFGEIWIRDDHLLTYLGMTAICFVIPARFALALMIDTLPTKTSQIILSSSVSLACLFFCFTPQINQWIFALWTCLFMGLCSGVFLVFPALTLKLFGQTYFASNYGCLMTSAVVLNLIAPKTVDFLLFHFGWPGLFISTGVINVLFLILSIVVLPK